MVFRHRTTARLREWLSSDPAASDKIVHFDEGLTLETSAVIVFPPACDGVDHYGVFDLADNADQRWFSTGTNCTPL